MRIKVETADKIHDILTSWIAYSLIMFGAMFFWDSSFPGMGQAGATPFTTFANVSMCVITVWMYRTIVTAVIDIIAEEEETPLKVDNSDLNELPRQATKKAEERV